MAAETKVNSGKTAKTKRISAKERQRINGVLDILSTTYKDTKSALKFNSTYQLLVAVILSAQTNDNQVNKITDVLFVDHGTPETMVQLSLDEMEAYIKTCGLYKNKAKNVLATSQMLLSEYGGQVPDTREELMKLPGVGRKTANVVLSVGFGKPAMAVDTHVFRVSHRLGLSNGKDPLDTEADICRVIPEKDWADAHHWLIWHGRKVCSAQRPKCSDCPLAALCLYKGEDK
ncbi:MAG: endonuclease III [Peptococcaceae bacterium]|jgi:endonuclease-3|nr:endonuclease III [Peptococcaceae bacterium]